MSVKTFLAAKSDEEGLTWRQYLRGLLQNLCEEGEGFNSKRPFGYSGWENKLTEALRKHHVSLDAVLDSIFGDETKPAR